MPDDAPMAELSEDWYRQIFETAPDAMVVVRSDGKIGFVNGQTERLFGYPREALVGKGLEGLIPERFRKGHAQHVARYFSTPSARPMGSGLQLYGLCADGKEIAIEVSLSPIHTKNGTLVSAAIRDISQRKRTEAAAKLAADRLVSAVDSIQDAFALFDASDNLVLCNSVYRSLLGTRVSGAVIGRSYEELLDAWLDDLAFPSDAERAQFRAERVAGRREAGATFDVRTKDGRNLRVSDRRTAEGGIVKTVWDLTEDVRLSEELQTARAVAESASSAKSEFLSSMSHELRTPLNAILGFAQLLRRDKKEPLSERHKDRTDQILRGGEHLLRLIDDILDLSRIEARTISISSEPVSVKEVLEQVRNTLEPMAARSGLSLEVVLPSTELPMIATDRTRFAQILMNYGSNAIKYNRPNGTASFVVSMPDSTHVRVTVADTGIGIPADKQDKLFQPFQRAGQETGPIEGTGIGLVITKRLAELMGGKVGFRSAPGEGSEFWVDMPVFAAPAVPKTTTLSKDAARGIRAAGQRRILYVEDNPANVLFMEDLLSSFENIELLTAPTAEMGIEIARSHVPTLIIMDINLPGMSGLDALIALRQLPETEHIAVIALTAAASEKDRLKGEQAGFYRYLTKPVRVDELEAALESLLSRTE